MNLKMTSTTALLALAASAHLLATGDVLAKAAEGEPLSIFVQLKKVDAANRLVYGVAAVEMPDRSGEIFDYTSSKPNFEKWSSDLSKASGGKSLGNLREMHGKVAAGLIKDMTFNDVTKSISICAEVVDDATWLKVEKGVLTGFSIGGGYGRRWPDAADPTKKRYTAVPGEISLVDVPCIPGATFEMVKADGTQELVKFATVANTEKTAAPDLSKYDVGALEKRVVTADERGVLFRLKEAVEKKTDVSPEDAAALVKLAAKDEVPTTLPEPVQKWVASDGSLHEKKELAKQHELQVAAKKTAGDITKSASDALGTLKGALDRRESDVTVDLSKLASLPHGKLSADEATLVLKAAGSVTDEKLKLSTEEETALLKLWSREFPAGVVEKLDLAPEIKDEAALVKFIPLAVEGLKKRHAQRRAALLGLEKALPDALKLTKRTPEDLEKGMYLVAELAQTVQCLKSLCDRVESEQVSEYLMGGEDPSVPRAPGMLKTALSGLAAALRTYAQEETAELVSGQDDDALEMCFSKIEMAKANAVFAVVGEEGVFAPLAKAGARNSKADSARIQAMHDHSKALGASCDDKSDTEKLAAAGNLSKMVDSELQKTVGDMTVTIAALAARLKEMEDTPLPTKGLLKIAGSDAVMVIAREMDGTGTGTALRAASDPLAEFQGHLAKMNDHDRALALTKLAMSTPVEFRPQFPGDASPRR